MVTRMAQTGRRDDDLRFVNRIFNELAFLRN